MITNSGLPTLSAGQTLPPGYLHPGVAREIAPTLRAFGIDPEEERRARKAEDRKKAVGKWKPTKTPIPADLLPARRSKP